MHDRGPHVLNELSNDMSTCLVMMVSRTIASIHKAWNSNGSQNCKLLHLQLCIWQKPLSKATFKVFKVYVFIGMGNPVSWQFVI